MGRTWKRRRGSIALATGLVASIVLVLAPAGASAKPGALDRSFGIHGRVATATSLGGSDWLHADVQIAGGPDGTVVAAAGNTVFRYLPDGSLDPSFGDSGKLTIADPEGLPFSLNDLAVDREGRVVLFGAVAVTDTWVPVSYIGTTVHPSLAAIARYDGSGRPDLAFDGDGFLVTDFALPAYAPGHYDKAFVALVNGTLDDDGNLIAIVESTMLTGPCSGGRYPTTSSRVIVRLTPTGGLDPRFDGDGVKTDAGFADIFEVANSPGGRPLLGGEKDNPCDERSGYTRADVVGALQRLQPDGSADPSFGRRGLSSLPSPPSRLAFDRSGRVVVLGIDGFGGWLLRLTPRGALDRSFGYRGGVAPKLPGESSLSAIVVEPSGRVCLAGTQALPRRGSKRGAPDYRRSLTVIRLRPSGKPDRGFGVGGWVATRFGKHSRALGQEAFIDSNGRLVVGGPIARPDLAPTGGIALARYRLGR
jgi:uncharacterized delta-60 repeat protein